ncbi:type III-B CRISPR module RAMP protein Cmr4 [Ignicoccus hospitalis]|uniref:CRISPR-associated RAMP protein, Cmr4 family n=1 Tax=Ignicoccus hospitalis (strain KIN4/I / DSM 18386 / JCM 14125) TaxID=453591 RepID=A8A9P1_IGNH4|nr:type III-B CRISPR module RAMP protein Cmr4 [Ignicoccus hospitalis]ABU81643.1 CRISPR-associated RAMP protein, Cmr4 family [Ignicoccus hospitalis KIN4/I]HIH89760.1 type III-B CRISPR module RAMP protein Cmr4 [Desulfurococcaceae archaeon]
MAEELVPALMSALTHVHVGAGRSPGTVDQPIIKDPMGIPFIPGSSVKGALKSEALLSRGCAECPKPGEDDEECERLCCLLGPDDGEKGASRIVVADFYPLLVPLPSLDKGFIYITSELLLGRAESVGLTEEALKVRELGEERVFVGTEPYVLKKVKFEGEAVLSLHPFLKKRGGEAYLVDEENLPLMLEKSLIRLTRVSLDRKTKTAASGRLWTEEYLPHGTVLSGAFAYRGWENEYCRSGGVGNWKRLLGLEGPKSLVLGGKETVGKGLVRITLA